MSQKEEPPVNYPLGWPPQGIIHPDREDETWQWYCPLEAHAGEVGHPGERSALRYLIAHLGGHTARDGRPYLIPARLRLMELVRAGAGAGPGHGDLIVLWAEVAAGDRVLHEDGLIEVERAEIIDKPWGDDGTFPAVDITYRGWNGRQFVTEQHGDRLTAVRRP
jgi:hypothetical protein